MKSFKLLLPALALAISGVAAAGTRVESDVPSVVVSYGDLNLASKDGVATLHKRLRGAAQIVCTSLDSRVLGLREQYDRCVKDAVSQSVAAVGNGNLSNYHRYGSKFSAVASLR